MPVSFAARSALPVWVLVSSVALSSLAARAQTPEPPTLRLDALLAEVEAANPTLRAARLEAAALAEVGAQVGALPDPTVGVTVSPYPILTARGAQRSQWRIEQAVPWPGTLGLRERVADLGAEVAGNEADALALDLAFAVKRAYYDLNHAHHVEATVRAYQERLGAFTEAAAVRYEVGRGPQGAILQIQLEAQRLGERLNALAAHRAQALQTLARLTDRPDLVGHPVAVEPPMLPEDPDALLALALRQRPEVRALEVAQERAEAEVALAQKARYPELTVGVTYSDIADREAPPTADGRDAFGVMLSAKIPLQRGRLRARAEEARLRRAQIEARQEALDTELRTQIATLAERVHTAHETLALFEDRLRPLAASTVESTLAAYTTGQADYLAFLDAERTRFQVQLAAADALHVYLTATAALERALGTASLTGAGAMPGSASGDSESTHEAPHPVIPDSDPRLRGDGSKGLANPVGPRLRDASLRGDDVEEKKGSHSIDRPSDPDLR